MAGGSGIDSCNGDSGGPLYLLTDRGDYLIGVTSRGFRDSNQACGDGGIYTRPDAAIAWIEQMSGVTLTTATCNVAPIPEAASIDVEVEAGETVEVEITATDPDGEDEPLTFSVGAPPGHGVALVEADGTLSFTAQDDFEGTDALTVVVADAAAPPGTATVLVNITILPRSTGCDCSSNGGHAGAAWPLAAALAAVLWPRRRRRRA